MLALAEYIMINSQQLNVSPSVLANVPVNNHPGGIEQHDPRVRCAEQDVAENDKGRGLEEDKEPHVEGDGHGLQPALDGDGQGGELDAEEAEVGSLSIVGGMAAKL